MGSLPKKQESRLHGDVRGTGSVHRLNGAASPMAMMMVPVVMVMVRVVEPVVPMMVMVPIVAIMGLLDEAYVAAVDTGIAHRHRCGLR